MHAPAAQGCPLHACTHTRVRHGRGCLQVPEGYCQISCGRCYCCPKLADVLRGRGLNMTLWAMSFTGGEWQGSG